MQNLIKLWPDADTTSSLLARMKTEDIASVLDWKSDSKKMDTLRALVDFLSHEHIETPLELREKLNNDDFRCRLMDIKGVGEKTIDYLSILTGSADHVAVDSQLRAFVQDAGCRVNSYQDIRDVITEAARERGWSAGALDAAIWNYQTGRAESV